jgi:hypothetical protein
MYNLCVRKFFVFGEQVFNEIYEKVIHVIRQCDVCTFVKMDLYLKQLNIKGTMVCKFEKNSIYSLVLQ